VNAAWKGEGAVEVLALDPELEFAGFVTGVVAEFEGGDDDNFYDDGCGWGGLCGGAERDGETRQIHEERCESAHSMGNPGCRVTAYSE
jgi:hypothetical protein